VTESRADHQNFSDLSVSSSGENAYGILGIEQGFLNC